MSITFAPEYVDCLSVIACSCGSATTDVIYTTRTEAYAILISPEFTAPICGDEFCLGYNAWIRDYEEKPEVNMSNYNALAILDALEIGLGDAFEERCVGTISAFDLQEKLLLADVFQPEDEGTPTYELEHDGNARIIMSGRPIGYIQSKIASIAEVVEYALTHNLNVVWS